MARYELRENHASLTRSLLITTNHQPPLAAQFVISRETEAQEGLNIEIVARHLLEVADQFERLFQTVGEAQAAAEVWGRRMERAFNEAREQARWNLSVPFNRFSQFDPYRSGFLCSSIHTLTVEEPLHIRNVDWGEEITWQRQAEERAWTLLLQHLSEDQRDCMTRRNEFQVRAADGRLYTLRLSKTNNIMREDGTVFCAGPENVPLGDFLLAQKLLLESDPEALLRHAPNRNGNRNTAVEVAMLQRVAGCARLAQSIIRERNRQ